MECEVDACDVKPDMKPDLAALASETATQPEAASAASSPEAQRCPLPSCMVRWGTPIVTPQPPPMRPRNVVLRMQREAAAAAATSDRISGRQIKLVAAVSAVSSDSDTCYLSDLSDLIDLSISDDERDDGNDHSNSVFDDRQVHPASPAAAAASVSCVRWQFRSNIAATSQ